MPKTKIQIEWKIFTVAVVIMAIAGIALAPKEEPIQASEKIGQPEQYENIVPLESVQEFAHVETVEEIIRRVAHEEAMTPEETERFVRIAWCESRNNPAAVSKTNDHGLFQINARYWDFDRTRIYDAEYNARYAMQVVYPKQGFNAWVCNPK